MSASKRGVEYLRQRVKTGVGGQQPTSKTEPLLRLILSPVKVTRFEPPRNAQNVCSHVRAACRHGLSRALNTVVIVVVVLLSADA